jgi:protein phosphatase
MVAEQHVGVAVRCGHCGQQFTARDLVRPTSTPTVPSGPPRLDIGSATSVGRVRRRNEDSFLVQHLVFSTLDECHEIALLVVADGMGGQNAGDRASGIVIRSVGSALAPLLGGALSGQFASATPDALTQTIEFALQEANRAVYRAAQREPAFKGMGATVAVALIWDGRVLVGHVGDCRTYHLHGDQLECVTRDQTLVARMVEQGTLTPDEAARHPERHLVTQAAGTRFDIKPDLHRLQLVPSDWLVIACDGLYTHVNESSIRTELLQPSLSATRRAHRLVELANADGGSDNCTVLAVNCC